MKDARDIRIFVVVAAVAIVSLCAVPSAGAKLYLMSIGNGINNYMSRANSTGQITDTEFVPTGHIIGGCCTHIANGASVATDGSHLYWTDADYDQGTDSSIGRAKLDDSGEVVPGSVTQTFLPLAGIAGGIAITLQPDGTSLLYWTHTPKAAGTTGIGQLRLDADGEVVPASEVDNFITLTAADDPAHIALSGNDIYWSNQGTNAIGHARVDATGALVGAPDPQAIPSGDIPEAPGVPHNTNLPDVWAPTGVAVTGGYVYWTDYEWQYSGTDHGDGHQIGRVPVGADGLPSGPVENQFITGAGSAGQAFTGTQTATSLSTDGTYLYWGNAGLPFFNDKDDDVGRAPIADPMGEGFSYSWVRTTMTTDVLAMRDASVHAECPTSKDPVVTCTVTVSDLVTTGTEAPLGRVIFSGSGRGTFDPANSECLLSRASATTSTCVIDYTRGGTGGELISANYAGSNLYSSAKGTGTLLPVPVDAPPDNGAPILPPGNGAQPPPKHKKQKCKKPKKGKKKAAAAKKKKKKCGKNKKRKRARH